MKAYKLVFVEKKNSIRVIPSLSVYKKMRGFYFDMYRAFDRRGYFNVVPLEKNKAHILDDTNSFPYGVYASILYNKEQLERVNFNSRKNLFLKYY